MRRTTIWQIGGFISGAVLIVFGAVALYMGITGYQTVSDELDKEHIVGGSDMAPAEIQKAASEAGLPNTISLPTCNVVDEQIDTGGEARCFAQYMRIHTFGATSGLTYSQMGRFVAKPGTPIKYTDGLGATSDEKYAALDPKTQQPVSNGRRDIWVTYTALTTALNSSYMASKLAVFGVVVGIALLLAGIGFLILAVGGALESPKPAFGFLQRGAKGGGVAAKA